MNIYEYFLIFSNVFLSPAFFTSFIFRLARSSPRPHLSRATSEAKEAEPVGGYFREKCVRTFFCSRIHLSLLSSFCESISCVVHLEMMDFAKTESLRRQSVTRYLQIYLQKIEKLTFSPQFRDKLCN